MPPAKSGALAPKKVRRTNGKQGHDEFPRLDDFKRCAHCQTLIEAALANGGKDNVTVIVIVIEVESTE